MAACRQCCIAGPSGNALSTAPLLLALLDCPLLSLRCFSLDPVRSDCPLSLSRCSFFLGCSAWWTVLFFVSSSSRIRSGRLSGCYFPAVCSLVSLLLALLTACWGALFSRVLVTVCFVIDWGCPLAFAVLASSVFFGGSFYSVVGGCQPPALCRTHSLPVSDISI